MGCFGGFYSGKRVLLTGHTGFKGAWLSEWLLELGAELTGLALAPDTSPSLFTQLGLKERLNHFKADIRSFEEIKKIVDMTQPEVVFHLAAQPLVRLSYEKPRETFDANLMGTVNMLHALRSLNKPCVAVFITTDKCYENREWNHGYRESDPLGGDDPYSASKACAEIAISAYRRSFFSSMSVAVASARAGNVIGGGDWAKDRIVPDCIRSLTQNKIIGVRNRYSTRPWQHVLDPLSGYLALGERLGRLSAGEKFASGALSSVTLEEYASAFNFGPLVQSNQSVAVLVKEVLKRWPGDWEDQSDPNAPHEASKLNLGTDKAFHLLGWQPVWGFEETVRKTIDWYFCLDGCSSSGDFVGKTREQMKEYVSSAANLGLAWAQTDK